MPVLINLVGKRFGKLTVLEKGEPKVSKNGFSQVRWLCQCDCGNKTLRHGRTLRSGEANSCGCITAERLRKLVKEKNPGWKRGWINDEYGYKLVRNPAHHRAKSNGYVREHIVVMEQKIGRLLLKEETVHHINGIKDDNRPENLELWTKNHAAGQRVEDLVSWAKEIIELYGK